MVIDVETDERDHITREMAHIAGLDWRPIFLLNVPVGVVVLILAARLVPEVRGRDGGLDPTGAFWSPYCCC